MIEVLVNTRSVVEVSTQQNKIVEISAGVKGDTFEFSDLTPSQINQLKADIITTASEIQITSLTSFNDTLSATNVQNALEEIETKTIYGGSF